MWLVAGNRCLQCDGLGEAGMLNEVGGLTVDGRGGDTGQNIFKKVEWKNRVGKQRFYKGRTWCVKWWAP